MNQRKDIILHGVLKSERLRMADLNQMCFVSLCNTNVHQIVHLSVHIHFHDMEKSSVIILSNDQT